MVGTERYTVVGHGPRFECGENHFCVQWTFTTAVLHCARKCGCNDGILGSIHSTLGRYLGTVVHT